MSAANRRRGHDCERNVCAYLRSQGWPDACTTRSKLGSDGTNTPGDIDFEPGVCLEVKDVAKSAWPSWRAQCVAEAQGRVPVVLRRTRGQRDVGQWRCQVRVADWPDLADSAVPCARTGTDWCELPFAEVVAELRRQHQEVA